MTARGEAEDRVKGLESGADDYVAKPFNTKELILRVGKVLNRGHLMNEHATKNRLKIGGVMLDSSIYQLIVDDQEVQLTATEFRLLKLLMERKNRVQTREKIY